MCTVFCTQEQWTERSKGFLQDFVNGKLDLSVSSSDDELLCVSNQIQSKRTGTCTCTMYDQLIVHVYKSIVFVGCT